jgi:hypothetical protein
VTTAWLALAAFAATSVLTWARAMRLYHGVGAGTRTRRRLSQEMITAIGLWQLTVAAVLLAMPEASWTAALPVGLCGLAMIGVAWFMRRTGLPA